jgi:hypothetical protein
MAAAKTSSSAGYDTATYLLDQSNIRETVEKIPIAYDTKSTSMITDEVYAPKCVIDYTALLGGEPSSTTGAKYARALLEMLGPMKATQHVVA